MKKLIHISDVHFDAPMKSMSDRLRQAVRSGRRAAFRKAVDMAVDERIDAFLIAGDLFDSGMISPGTEIFLEKELLRLTDAGIKVYYASGNHDPANRLDFLKAADVHVFRSGEPEIIRHDNELNIVGIGHADSREMENKIRLFPKRDKGIYVGVAHAMVSGTRYEEGKEKYMPAEISDVVLLDYDYFALGHIHMRQSVHDEKVWYSGCPQGGDISETGEKGFNFITVDRGETSVNFIKSSSARFSIVEAQIDDENASSIYIDRKIRDAIKGYGMTDAIRVIVTGKLSKSSLMVVPECLDDIADDADVLHIEFKNRTSLSVDEEKLSESSPVIREIIELLGSGEYGYLAGSNLKLESMPISDIADYITKNLDDLRQSIVRAFIGDDYEG